MAMLHSVPFLFLGNQSPQTKEDRMQHREKKIKDQLKGLYDRALAMSKGQVRGIMTKENEVIQMILTVSQISQDLGNLASVNGNAAVPRSLKDIFQECLDRYDEAGGKYGEFDPLKDQRDLVREAQEELSDVNNYLCFMLIKAYAVQFAFSGNQMLREKLQKVA
jgi:hypothetical protein